MNPGDELLIGVNPADMSPEARAAAAKHVYRGLLIKRKLRLSCEMRLIDFIAAFWHIVEPEREFVRGWAIEGLCEHLEAVTAGEITRLLLNVPPGFLKSLATSVFWPAWEWGPRGMSSMRYLTASYSQGLTVRDNGKFLRIIKSDEYRSFWPAFDVVKDNVIKPENDRTGWKLATSVSGLGTGERGDRVILDDPNNVKEAESKIVRDDTNKYFTEVLPSRLNDQQLSAIIVIQQRTHEQDVSGTALDPDRGMNYTHFMVPMEYDSGRHCSTVLAYDSDGFPTKTWSDPRTEDGDLAFPERFPRWVVDREKMTMGEYAVAAQFQQLPAPRGGGIFKRINWRDWPPEDHPERDTHGRIDFPGFEYVIASLDTAFTEKQENDPSALTIWGIWRQTGTKVLAPTLVVDNNVLVRLDDDQRSKIMLIYGWKKRVKLHGPPEEMPAGMSEHEWKSPRVLRERQKNWGLVEWVAHACINFRIDRLLIENKANGADVAGELQRLFGNQDWGTELINPKGDKVNRAISVEHLFSNGLVYAPMIYLESEQRWAYPEWCDTIISDMAVFPKGGRDITDSATQALKYLRDRGLAVRNDEQDVIYEEMFHMKKRRAPLYPV